MAVGVDGQQLHTTRLERGDDSWQTVVVPVDLEAGFHTINLWFFNDGMVDGNDRNAEVDWVEIRKQLP